MMRKSKRNAIKLEAKVQRLTSIKLCGTIDEKRFAKRKLADGVSSRFIPPKRYNRVDNTDVVLGGRKVL